MAKTRKAAPARRKPGRKRKTSSKAAARAAKKKPARKVARKRARKAAKPESLGARFAHAVGGLLETLADAERLHNQTTRKAGVQEFE